MKKIIALILALCCILPLAVACGNTDMEDDTDIASDTVESEAASENNVLWLSKNGKSVYNVVVPEKATTELRDAAQSLIAKIGKETGAIIKMTDDSSYDGSVTDGEYEILIGNVRRTDTQKVLEDMAFKDYKITVTEKNLVIASRDSEAAVAAIWRFISLMKAENIVRDDATKSVSLLWSGDIYQKGDSYSLDQLKIDGKEVKDYVIVYPVCKGKMETDAYLEYAEGLRDWIGMQTGYVLDVVSDETEAKPLEILIGKTSRAESQAFYENAKLSMLEYKIGVANGKAFLVGAMAFSTSKAIEAFRLRITQNGGVIDTFDSAKMTLNTAFRKNTADYRIMQYNVLVEFDGWGSGGDIVPSVEVRKELIGSMILGYMPDVLVLCEFFDNWRAQLPPILEDDYDFVQIDIKGTSNRTPVAYRSSRFNLIASAAESIETYQNINNRVVTWAVLEDKTTGDYIIVFGTHFNSDAPTKENGVWFENDRLTQANRTVDIVKKVVKDYPETATRKVTTILTGDFNTRSTKAGEAYEFPAYAALINGLGMKNAFEGVAGNGVDHMFYNEDELEIKQAVIENAHFSNLASDHRPIIADVNVK